MSEFKLLNELIEAKLLVAAQAQGLEEKSKEKNVPIFELLRDENLIPESDLLSFFAKRAEKLFFEKILDSSIDTNLLIKVPFKFLRQNVLLPILYEGKVLILMASPKSVASLCDLASLFTTQVDYAFSPKSAVLEALNRFYPFNVGQAAIDELNEAEENSFDLDEVKEQDLVDMANDAPIVKLVNHMIFQAVKEGASDIHVEPFEKDLRIRFRIDGVMQNKFSPPKRYHGAIISRIKIISDLNIAEKRLPQDGRIQVKVTDKSIDLRVSILPCNFGERVVMRILDKSKGIAELEKISLSERDFGVIVKSIARPNGIILVCGPTGSGKTTTLYSLLYRLNDSASNIITVEDPVEYTIPGVNQVQVNTKTGLTFSVALKSILRQDPDIALIGEIRDKETAQIATQAALTGHLVLSTIHTNSAPGSITRLIDMGIEPFLIASSLVCVIAQRLVRSLCQQCKVPFTPDKEFFEKLHMPDEAFDAKTTLYKAVGCKECLNTGYKGRLPLFEVMEISEKISSLIVKKTDTLEIKKQAISDGMVVLASDGMRKAKLGLTTLEEVLSVAFVDS